MSESYDAEARSRAYFDDWDFLDDAGPEHETTLAAELRQAHASGRREGIEEAAAACDVLAVRWSRDSKSVIERGRAAPRARCEGAAKCSARIRALLTPESEETSDA